MVSVSLVLMLVLGNSCAECEAPSGDEMTLIVPRIPAVNSGCGYNPSFLRTEADLARDLSDDGWRVEIKIRGKCANNKGWEKSYKKGDFGFFKNPDGSMEFTLDDVPYGEPLSLAFTIHSNCNDNSTGHCFNAGTRDYRAILERGLDPFRLTMASHTVDMLLPPVDQGEIIAGIPSGCR